jgi:hypothetical protein
MQEIKEVYIVALYPIFVFELVTEVMQQSHAESDVRTLQVDD